MKTTLHWMLPVILASLLLGACGAFQPEPTPTLTPSNTPSPTATNTPPPTPTFTITPTFTPEPTHTSTPTPEPFFEAGDVREVPGARFAYQPIKGYELSPQDTGFGMFNARRTIVISFYGEINTQASWSEEEIVDEFLGNFEEQGTGQFVKGEETPITIDGVEGTAYELEGTMMEEDIQGRAVVVKPSADQFLFGLAIAKTDDDPNLWEDEGAPLLAALMETMTFIDPPSSGESACPVSTDETYGYSKDNPIRVGGDWLNGPARERAYLDSLSGPGGETVSYFRQGSIDHGSTILDIYKVSYSGGKEITLYLDEYSYEELKAPLGFTCWTPIPLSAP